MKYKIVNVWLWLVQWHEKEGISDKIIITSVIILIETMIAYSGTHTLLLISLLNILTSIILFYKIISEAGFIKIIMTILQIRMS